MAKEKQEYDYEGDMAMSQLKSIIANAQRIHDMLSRDTNIPEWVQSKITLAEDYISTAANYMQGEMSEEVNIDKYADMLIKRDRQNLSKSHVVHAARVAGVDHKKLVTAVRLKVGRIKEETLDELSKDTLKSYAAKADARTMDRTIDNPKAHNKAQNRTMGIEKAVKKIAEEATHSVHVKTYDSHGEKQMKSPEFKKHVTAHGGELDYASDKGAAFKFKSHSHAAAFHRGVQSKFKELDSEHDMHEDVAMGTGPVNVAANVADPKNKRLFAKPMKRFKSFKAK